MTRPPVHEKTSVPTYADGSDATLHGSKQTAVSTKTSDMHKNGAYLVILVQKIGWDFSANDLAKNGVATRLSRLGLLHLRSHVGR